MKPYCYLNGKIVPLNQAKISVEDIGILRGYGVFDILRTYRGQPFQLAEHYERWRNSAKILNLNLPLKINEVRDLIAKLMKLNKMAEARVRIVLTGGKAIDGMDHNTKDFTIFILAEKLTPMPAVLYQKGGTLVTLKHQRNLPEAKIINYQTGIKNNAIRTKAKAVEILYVSDGKILEGMGSNFFLFRGKTLITAKDNILRGTTRNLIIKLARKKFKVEVRDIKLSELKNTTECFITSITKGVLPIVKIDNQKIGDGRVGENTKFLMKEFQTYTDKY